MSATFTAGPSHARAGDGSRHLSGVVEPVAMPNTLKTQAKTARRADSTRVGRCSRDGNDARLKKKPPCDLNIT